MAYKTTTDRVAEIREELKKEFPDFKFSIRKDGYNGVRISILSAPIDLMEGETEKYVSVNTYYINEHYKDRPKAREALSKIYEIANRGVTYRETGDYGTQPSFYVWINIGSYDKPFEYKPKKGRATSTRSTSSAPSSSGAKWDRGEVIRECAGWKVYKKTLPDGRIVYNVLKDKETPANKGDWDAIRGEIYTDTGFKWGRFGAFEKWGSISNESETLDKLCQILTKYYAPSSTPSAPASMPESGDFNIRNIVSELSWSQGLKEMMIDDFTKSGYEDVRGIIGGSERQTSQNIQDRIIGFSSGKHTYLQANMLADVIHKKLSEESTTTPTPEEKSEEIKIYIDGDYFTTSSSEPDAYVLLLNKYGITGFPEMQRKFQVFNDAESKKLWIFSNTYIYGKSWNVTKSYGNELQLEFAEKGFKVFLSAKNNVLVIYRTDMATDGIMISDNGGEFNLDRYGYNEFISSINYVVDDSPLSPSTLANVITDIYEDYFSPSKSKTTSKEDLQKAINGLQILADKGNEKAKKAIIGLKILLNK